MSSLLWRSRLVCYKQVHLILWHCRVRPLLGSVQSKISPATMLLAARWPHSTSNIIQTSKHEIILRSARSASQSPCHFNRSRMTSRDVLVGDGFTAIAVSVVSVSWIIGSETSRGSWWTLGRFQKSPPTPRLCTVSANLWLGIKHKISVRLVTCE